MQALSGLPRRTLAIVGLVLAAVILLSVNFAARQSFRLVRADLTQSGLYTISDSTRQVLSSLDDPVTVRLYYSKVLGDRAPSYGQYAERIASLLGVYADLSNGRLRFETVEPEPFSDAEDRAVAAGLRGVALGQGQDTAYLGLVGINSTDDQEVIPFMALERAEFLEYDLTKLVHKLADPARKVLGLITDLPMQGGMDPQRGPQPPWTVSQQIGEFFTVRPVESGAAEIPADVDVLLIVSAEGLAPKTAYAVDQFALNGKPVFVFADPLSEVQPFGKGRLKADDPLNKLLATWGASLEPGKAVGDISFARRVQYGSAGQPRVADYVVWMTLDRGAFDTKDAIFSNVGSVVFATPGSLKPANDAGDRFRPLIRTTDRAMLIEEASLVAPDPEKLLVGYQPGGQSLVLAARLMGEAKTAFPDGPPKAEGEQAKPGEQVKSGKVNAIVVADTDLLYDTFWAEARDIAGQRFIVPRANNIDLLLNALENLSGGAALSGLRGRGVEERPFTLVRKIRQEAEARYRKQEEALNQKLEQAQNRLSEIQNKSQDGKIMLSEEDKRAILGFRQEIVAIRQDLRGVQRALRQDIERLEFWVKFLNTAGLPLLIGFGGLGFLAFRRSRSHPTSGGKGAA